MAEGEYQTGECQETAGFLFAHRCGSIAVRECADCQKPICQQHTVDLGGLLKCVSCAKAARAPGARRGPQGGRTDAGDNYYPYHGPYFYSDGYYYSMGGRPRYPSRSQGTGESAEGGDVDDFTDSDEAALTGGEPDGNDVRGFENDMGAS